MASAAAPPTRRMLIAFDFDHTVVDKNTDVEVQDLVPKDVLKDVSRKDGWTKYMDDVLKTMHAHGVTRDAIVGRMEALTLTEGFRELLEAIRARQRSHGDVEVIVASDSNTVFIETILAKQGLVDIVAKVYTNPAVFVDGTDRLSVAPFTTDHGCDVCVRTPNMCKRQIVSKHIASNPDVEYTSVHYVGDGGNDFCPLLRLRECDYVFARHGYALHKLLGEPERAGRVRAQKVVWEEGSAILTVLAGKWESHL